MSTNKNSKKRGRSFRDYLEKRSYRNFLSIIAFSVVLFIFIINKVDIKTVSLEVGDLSPTEIRANKDVVDKKATEKLKADIKKNHEDVYRQNPSVQTTMKSSVSNFIYNLKKYKKEELPLEEKIELLSKDTNVVISKEDYRTALGMDDREIDDFKMVLDDLIGQIMSQGIEEKNLEKEKANVEKLFKNFDYSIEKQNLGVNIINSVLQPNRFLDKEETKARLDEKLEELEPVMIKEHQVILSKGERVTQESLDALDELGLLKESQSNSFYIIIGVMTLTILLVLALYVYIRIFNSELLEDGKLAMVFIVILGTLILSDLVSNFSLYIIPIAIAPMLIALLIDIRLGLVINTFITFILSISLKLDSGLVAMYLLSGSFGSFVIKKNQQRYDLMITGVLVGLINLLTIASFGLIKNLELKLVLTRSLYGFMDGILSGILTVGTLPLWESGFKVITPIRLIELSNPNEPLLKRLLLEAPGTYHHSIVVGNLSERAAEDIGANALLARVGAYYHDIGKLTRPYFFKENQIGMSNPHDHLEPEKSAKIIINHVTDGVKLAKEARLPREIIDILEQHHGDTKVMYFYYLAKEKDPNVEVDNFKYNNPKPKTKEAAIVMMADSSEAAVRSIQDPDRESISDMVRKVINGKLEDGQFSECDINFKDIDKIEKAFISTFMGMFHERIEYPNMEDLK